jgi:hypothetical protein
MGRKAITGMGITYSLQFKKNRFHKDKFHLFIHVSPDLPQVKIAYISSPLLLLFSPFIPS